MNESVIVRGCLRVEEGGVFLGRRLRRALRWDEHLEIRPKCESHTYTNSNTNSNRIRI